MIQDDKDQNLQLHGKSIKAQRGDHRQCSKAREQNREKESSKQVDSIIAFCSNDDLTKNQELRCIDAIPHANKTSDQFHSN